MSSLQPAFTQQARWVVVVSVRALCDRQGSCHQLLSTLRLTQLKVYPAAEKWDGSRLSRMLLPGNVLLSGLGNFSMLNLCTSDFLHRRSLAGRQGGAQVENRSLINSWSLSSPGVNCIQSAWCGLSTQSPSQETEPGQLTVCYGNAQLYTVTCVPSTPLSQEKEESGNL